jgi:hypothetical protein
MFYLVNDRLPFRIRDGVRYMAEKRRGKKILEGIEKKRSSEIADARAGGAKKQKAMYMVDPKKFASTATEEEMARELTEDDLGTEETHRILQCKIR